MYPNHGDIHRQINIPVVGVFTEAAFGGEDYDGHLCITKHRQLIGLLKKAIPALANGHLPIGGVLNTLDLYLPSPHLSLFTNLALLKFGKAKVFMTVNNQQRKGKCILVFSVLKHGTKSSN